jgi:hypothetical protein
MRNAFPLAVLAATTTAACSPTTMTITPRAPVGRDVVQFPAITTDDLNGMARRLPDGVPGDLKLFLIAYEREQQADIDPWLTVALRLERAHAGFRVYELPTLARRWALARRWIDGGMRGGIPDRTARARTLTLYLDKDDLARALHLPDEHQVYALLVDRDGRVVWRRAGRPDEAAARALADEVGARLTVASGEAP